MSDLSSIGSSAIRAYQTALATVGSNVSNSQTPGYVRRTTQLTELAPSGTSGASRFHGVAVGAISRQYDSYLAESARHQSSESATANSRSQGMIRIEESMDILKDGIGSSISQFYDSAQQLAAQPTSISAQKAFRNSLAEVTRQFRTTGSSLAQTAADLAATSENQVSAANDDIANLALVNGQIARERAGSAAHAALLDRRDSLLDSLASKIAISTNFAENGSVRVDAAHSGTAILDGPNPSYLSIEQNGGAAVLRITSNSATSQFRPAGGSIAGTMLAQGVAAQRIVDIDQLAEQFADHINLWSADGLTPTGQAGAPLIGGTQASDLVTLSAVEVALPLQKDGQSNGNILSLLGTRDAAGFERRWTEIASSHSSATASIGAQAKILDATLEATRLKIDDVSGVNLDQEAADLLRYQQAYNAAAKILKTADDVITSILNIT